MANLSGQTDASRPSAIRNRRESCAVSRWILAACASLLFFAAACPPALCDDGGGEENDKIPRFFEELFLGEIAYPQEQGEIQFTTGFFQNAKYKNEYALPVIVEYGITDNFQVAVGLPVEFKRPVGRADGAGNIEFDAYWTFLNDVKAGRMCGTGFAVGLPTATPDVGDEAVIFEPYFIALKQYEKTGFNLSAGLEVKSPVDRDEEAEVEGYLALAAYRQYGKFVPMLEFSILLEEDTQVRLAPGLYWQPSWTKAEFGVSLPIGLNSDTPAIGVWMLSTIELEPNKRKQIDFDDD